MLGRSVEGIEEEDLFAAALALPSTERDAYLKRACSADSDLLNRLMSLVAAFGGATSFVTGGAPSVSGTDRIGPYRLLRELGEGGCGIAYLAEQATPVKRQVAVKIIKPGMDTKAVIARFEAERQALALMDHPNVAKVFDAGTTHVGRPYFVMELVRGIKITEFCSQSRLSVEERLSLFTQVCQAILHAHQKGIIHRDIKPSNVLVTMHDGLPLIKVIDFGIAKATQGRLTDQTLHTDVDQIVGTPAYISPEQTEPAQSAVDTRSDIYSLGALLYELLTSQTPFDARELAQVGIERLRELLRTEEPPLPSRRLSSIDGEFLTRISAGSGAKLAKQFRDDLDWIVMQCLEKEPSRRYQTVSELTADLHRYLRHEPVLARPPSVIYAIRKLARRNRVAFASAILAVALALFITAFAIAMTIQSQRIATERDHAELERRRAQQVSNVVMNVFAIADPFQNFGNEVSAIGLLDQAARSITHELSDQPVPRARLLQAVGRGYMRRGEFKQSLEYLRDAVRVLSQLDGAENETLIAMIDLSFSLRISGDLNGAHESLARGERLARERGLERSAGYAKLLLNRGRIEILEGRILKARSDYEKSLQLYQQVVGGRSIEVAEVLSELSEILTWNDDHADAERLARRSIAIYDASAPSMHPDRVTAELRLAQVLYLQNQLDDAGVLLVEALRKTTQLFGHQSTHVVDALDMLAIVRYAQRRFGEAEQLSVEALNTSRVVFGEKHALTASMITTLARTLIELRKFAEAESLLREALATFAATLPADHQYVSSAEYFLGETLLATNRPTEAEAVLTASMNRWKRADAPPWRAMRSANALGEALYRQGRTTEGENYLSDSLRELSVDPKAERAAKDKARARAKRYLHGSRSPPPQSKQRTS